MRNLITATTNHIELIQELGTVSGVRLVAIKRGNDEVGFALVTKKDNVATIGKEDFNQITLSAFRLFSPSRFKELKSQHKTTPSFFKDMVSIMSMDK